MLAKITSELGKPAGLVVLSRSEALERFAADSPGLVPGIGPKTVGQAGADGHRAPWPPCASTTTRPWRRPSGPAWAAGCGAARRSRTTPSSRWSARSSRSRRRRPSTSTSPTRRRWPPRWRSLAEELCRRLRSRGLEGRTIGIKVRLDDWTNVTRSHTVETADQRPGAWSARSRSTCCAPTRRRGPVRLLGVRLAQFGEARDPRPSRTSPEPQLRARPLRLDA